MIITRLQGGLGNQMFQYAAGLRLAAVRQAPLKLDLSLLGARHGQTPRTYQLDRFRISAQRATPEEVEALCAKRPLAARISRRLDRRAAARERHFHYDPAVARLPDRSCLEGYWQSERYFADAAERVREEFRFRAELAGRNAELARAIAARAAVSVHVRRGDYAANPVTRAVHGLCSIDYYQRAAEYIAARVRDPVYVLFSDDPEWARAHLDLGGEAIAVGHNGPDDGAEDLRLIGLCRHHVIANSTFSWWGAWLSASPDKIVVAPERWFADGARDTSDLLPAGWVKR
ncbi:MAG TPA: alpha-1,2-fucosyltransferase [Myxococcota bacterium]|nr:alpha-1,2-fucosyltransferase [Myxococcota bacterium]